MRKVTITTIADRFLDIVAIPCLQDNYSYLIVNKFKESVWVIDPSEGGPVYDYIKASSLNLKKILCTHHHNDHTEGNSLLKDFYKDTKIYGFDARVPCLTDQVKDGEEISDENISVTVIHTPCHTTGSVCYLLSYESKKVALFTGDTVFLSGCGRFFEGDANQMISSLEKLRSLPDDVFVFPGHEYTRTNLKFALIKEPTNTVISEKLDRLNLSDAEVTVPGVWKEELAVNPFLRCVYGSGNLASRVEQLAKMRQEKDEYRG